MQITNKLITAGIFLSMMFVLTFLIPGVVNAQNVLCIGNNLYWYDSYGNLQGVAQYCTNGCYNNSCTYNNYNNYNYNNYNNCTSHAFKLCVGNNIYWYDSCNSQQDLYYNCSNNGQFCQYGQCVAYIQNYNNNSASNYIAYYKTACYGNSISWYDSLGVRSGLYKNCQDNNSCTADACSVGKCSNVKKCDGSTCAIGSADYNTYCPPAEAGAVKEGVTTPPPITPTPNITSNTNTSTNINTSGLIISFFAKQDSTSNQWQKTAQVSSNSQVYFMISATNNSSAQIDNVSVSANIPSEISSLGNLQLNGVPVSGDIVSEINIGSIAPATTKSITFEGKTQTISSPATKQATATSNISGNTQSDSVSINLNLSQNQTTAAVSSAPSTSGFWEFLKRWYLWIFIGVILVFLFIVVFRRLSSNI